MGITKTEYRERRAAVMRILSTQEGQHHVLLLPGTPRRYMVDKIPYLYRQVSTGTQVLVHACTGAHRYWCTQILVHACTGARVYWCTQVLVDGKYTYMHIRRYCYMLLTIYLLYHIYYVLTMYLLCIYYVFNKY